MSVGGWIGVGVAVLVVLLVIIFFAWYISCYNTFIRLRNNNEEAFSTMDVYMKKRYDLVPNLVSTVKGYAKHEKETLDAVISARNMAQAATGPEEKAKAESAFQGTIRNLMVVAENYPELKANTNFMDLQSQLKTLESEIASSRKYYNACVKTYNTKREVFPSNLVAKWKHFEKAPLFEIEDAQERKAVKVEF